MFVVVQFDMIHVIVVQIAAISPDAENYEQTLSTLKYGTYRPTGAAAINETRTFSLVSYITAGIMQVCQKRGLRCITLKCHLYLDIVIIYPCILSY